MTYRTLDHTADLALEVTAGSLESLFAESVRALTDCMTRLEQVIPEVNHEVAMAAPELDRLLVDLLSEVVFLHETEALVFSEASLSVAETESGWSLSGTLGGEEFDLERHGFKTLIKAVTYHELSVQSSPDGWIARIVFDL